jgi:hypothetical protein
MWKLARSWAKRRHPNKSGRWVVDRYFGAFHPTRRDRWIFGDRDSGAYLAKFAWTDIVRHQQVKGWASPDDPALADYWAERHRRRKPPLDRSRLRLLQAQHGRCPLCRGLLLHADHEPQTRTSGNSGSRRPARRSASKRSSPRRVEARRTNPLHRNSYTLTAHAGTTSAARTARHRESPTSLRGSLEPRCPETGRVRFLGGGGAAMRSRYPTQADQSVRSEHGNHPAPLPLSGSHSGRWDRRVVG